MPSAFGVHLVALTRHDPARPATLAEARADVERDLAHARLQQANAAFYDKLRAKYAVRIEGADARLPIRRADAHVHASFRDA